MKLEREKILATLDLVAVGTTQREVIEQSDCFTFGKRYVTCYSGEVLAQAETPLPGVRGTCRAADLLELLRKFPDTTLDVWVEGREIRLRGKRRAAGVDLHAGTPSRDVPAPGDWVDIQPETARALVQAARVCGRDDSQPRTTEVHVTPQVVEACDNYRYYRADVQTGLQAEFLVPAASILAVAAHPLARWAEGGGWLHLQSSGGARFALRCAQATYIAGVERLLDVPGGVQVQLPKSLPDALRRASTMTDDRQGMGAVVSVRLADGDLRLRAQKQGGWYEETRQVDYDGDPLSFCADPQLLLDVLSRALSVQVGGGRMRVDTEGAVFVICLDAPEVLAVRAVRAR